MAAHRKSIRTRVTGLLELEDGWITVHQLHAEYMLRYGPVMMDSFSRSLHRMRAAGEIEMEVIDSVYKIGNCSRNLPELRVRIM